MKCVLIIISFLVIFAVNSCLAGVSRNMNSINTYFHRQDSSVIDKQFLIWAVGSKAFIYVGSFIILDYLWYRDYPRTSFHFHNDNLDWKQIDKCGHIASTYHLSAASYETYRMSGLNNKKSALYGSITGTLFMTTIEIMDGFSKEWGFSWGDYAANIIGTTIFLSQQLSWGSQNIKIRYSYARSGLAGYRPDLFGSNYLENILKDYNGMTFWLSMNMNIFSKEDIFPSWLNIAIGYGASGMLGSLENPAEHNGIMLPELDRYRQWYLSPDIDLSKINVDSQILQTIFKVLDFIKLPAPAVEYNRKYGWGFHFVYF